MDDQSHILILTTGLRGRLNSTLALASRLRSAGYLITFASPWNCEDRITPYLFDFIQLPETTLHTTQYGSQQEALDALGVNNLVRIIEQHHPQLLLVDYELAAHIIAAQSVGIPMALISSWFDGSRAAGIPPLSAPIIPGRGFQGSRLGMLIAWTKFIIKRRWHYLSKRIRWQGKDYRSALSALAKRQNIDIINRTRTYDSFAVPFAWNDIPILCMNAAELDLPHQLPDNLIYVGPMVMSDRDTNAQNHPSWQHLQDLLQSARGEGASVIYCSVSTMPTELDLRSLIEEVAQRLPHLYFVVSSPLAKEITRKDRILYVPSVPQLYLLQHVQLVINHGGINTINECLHYGVPMVIISGRKFDQNGCAARVAYHRLGEVFFSTLSVLRLVESIKNNLASKDIKRRIKGYQEQVGNYKREARLEKVISELMAKTTV